MTIAAGEYPAPRRRGSNRVRIPFPTRLNAPSRCIAMTVSFSNCRSSSGRPVNRSTGRQRRPPLSGLEAAVDPVRPLRNVAEEQHREHGDGTVADEPLDRVAGKADVVEFEEHFVGEDGTVRDDDDAATEFDRRDDGGRLGEADAVPVGSLRQPGDGPAWNRRAVQEPGPVERHLHHADGERVPRLPVINDRTVARFWYPRSAGTRTGPGSIVIPSERNRLAASSDGGGGASAATSSIPPRRTDSTNGRSTPRRHRVAAEQDHDSPRRVGGQAVDQRFGHGLRQSGVGQEQAETVVALGERRRAGDCAANGAAVAIKASTNPAILPCVRIRRV